MIYFTDIDKHEILFQFFLKELPEDIPKPKKTKINHIEYAGGFQTNQIMGVFDQPIDWRGCFHGAYNINGEIMTAKERSDKLFALMGKPVRVGFPVPGMGPIPGLSTNLPTHDYEYAGDVGEFIIEEYVPVRKNYNYVEYIIRLVPHERPLKIRPDKTTTITVKPNTTKIEQNVRVVASSKKGTDKERAAANNKTAEAMQPQGFNSNYHSNINNRAKNDALVNEDPIYGGGFKKKPGGK